ncbi:MAG: hypothetical protein ACPLYF_02430 [Fervidobacterium sp.]|jgi:hypothetical protein
MEIEVQRVNEVSIELSNKWAHKNGKTNLTNFGKILLMPSIELHKKGRMLKITSTGLVFHVKVSQDGVPNYDFYVLALRNRSIFKECFLADKYYLDSGTLKGVLSRFFRDGDYEIPVYNAIVKKYTENFGWNKGIKTEAL